MSPNPVTPERVNGKASIRKQGIHTCDGERQPYLVGSEEPNKPTKYAAKYREVGRSRYSFVNYERTYWHRDQRRGPTSNLISDIRLPAAASQPGERKKYEK